MTPAQLNILRFINFEVDYLEVPRWILYKIQKVINFCLENECRIVHCYVLKMDKPNGNGTVRNIKVVGFVFRYVGIGPVPEQLRPLGYLYPGHDAIVNHKLSFELSSNTELISEPQIVFQGMSLDEILINTEDLQLSSGGRPAWVHYVAMRQ